MSTVRNKSMNARTFGDPDACWITVTHGSVTAHIPNGKHWAFIADVAEKMGDDRELYRVMSRAIQAEVRS